MATKRFGIIKELFCIPYIDQSTFLFSPLVIRVELVSVVVQIAFGACSWWTVSGRVTFIPGNNQFSIIELSTVAHITTLKAKPIRI